MVSLIFILVITIKIGVFFFEWIKVINAVDNNVTWYLNKNTTGWVNPMRRNSVSIGSMARDGHSVISSNASRVPPPPPQWVGEESKTQKGKSCIVPWILLGVVLIAAISVSGALIWNHNSELAAKDTQITSLNGQITNLSAQINTLQSEVATKNAQIASLQLQVSTLQSNLTSVISELGEKQAQIIALEQQVEGLDATISSLQTQLYDCQEQLEALSNVANEIEQLKQVNLNAINLDDWGWYESGGDWVTHSVRITGTVFNSGVYTAYNTTMHIYIYNSIGETIRHDEYFLGNLPSRSYVNIDNVTYFSGVHSYYEYNFTYVQG